MTTHHSTNTPGGVVTSLEPTDVLLGRGSGPNDHEGNILFRQLVSERKAEYMATNHRQTKAKIAREIVDTVLAHNGRFLKKMEPAEAKRLGVAKGVDAWCVVDDEDTILEKAKQALRQKGEKQNQEKTSDSPKRAPKKKKQPPPPPPVDTSPPAPETVSSAAYPLPPETVSHSYPSNSVDSPIPVGYSPTTDGMHYAGDETLNWQEYSGNQYEPPTYAARRASLSRNPIGGSTLSEECPPSRSQRELENERRAELAVHQAEMAVHQATAIDDEVLGDGPEDDDRRRSLQVADLMQSFNEMQTSSSSGNAHGSSDTMGTIDPLPMGASNVSMMSSSTFSIFKDALGATPRSSISRPASDSRRSSYARGDSTRSQHSGGSSDMSMSLSHVEAMWAEQGNNANRNNPGQISQVLEGQPGEEDASKRSLDPRPVSMMDEQPDTYSGLGPTSMSIIKTVFDGSGGGSSGLMTGGSSGHMTGGSSGLMTGGSSGLMTADSNDSSSHHQQQQQQQKQQQH